MYHNLLVDWYFNLWEILSMAKQTSQFEVVCQFFLMTKKISQFKRCNVWVSLPFILKQIKKINNHNLKMHCENLH